MDKVELELRPFEANDASQCRSLFRAGMVELIWPIFVREVRGYFPYAGILLSLVLAIRWSLQDAVVFVLACTVLAAVLYIFINNGARTYVNDACLKTDLRDIAEFYQNGSRMYVALLQNKVVGMAGIMHKDDHKPGEAEVVRMSVSSAIRKRGIATKLLLLIEQFCKDNNYNKMILRTSTAQLAAMALYEKHFFRETHRTGTNILFYKYVHYEKQIEL